MKRFILILWLILFSVPTLAVTSFAVGQEQGSASRPADQSKDAPGRVIIKGKAGTVTDVRQKPRDTRDDERQKGNRKSQ